MKKTTMATLGFPGCRVLAVTRGVTKPARQQPKMAGSGVGVEDRRWLRPEQRRPWRRRRSGEGSKPMAGKAARRRRAVEGSSPWRKREAGKQRGLPRHGTEVDEDRMVMGRQLAAAPVAGGLGAEEGVRRVPRAQAGLGGEASASGRRRRWSWSPSATGHGGGACRGALVAGARRHRHGNSSGELERRTGGGTQGAGEDEGRR